MFQGDMKYFFSVCLCHQSDLLLKSRFWFLKISSRFNCFKLCKKKKYLTPKLEPGNKGYSWKCSFFPCAPSLTPVGNHSDSFLAYSSIVFENRYININISSFYAKGDTVCIFWGLCFFI